MLPLGGAALMVALLVGQILEQTVRPYTWFPWVIVIWVVLMAAGALWLATSRPSSSSSPAPCWPAPRPRPPARPWGP